MNERTLAEPQKAVIPTATAMRGATLLQRECACGGSPGFDEECAECRGKRLALQRRSTSGTALTTVPPIVHDVLRASGQPMDATTRAFIEPRFGYDFSQVRVHTDMRAAESARAVRALAYTAGRDVVFGAGYYRPRTTEGKGLLAHELTHVVQQDHADTTQGLQPVLQCANHEDPFEREATAMSKKVVAGNDSKVSSGISAGRQQATGSSGMVLQREEEPASRLGSSAQLPPFSIPGTGLTLIPGPPRFSLPGLQIPLPASLRITNVAGIGTGPTFVVDLAPKRLLALILGSVDLYTWTRPGTPPGAEVDPAHQARISLLDPTIILDPVSGRLHGRATLSVGSDYPLAYKEPTKIDVSITSSELGQFTGRLGYGPLHADINLKLHYDLDRLEKGLQTSLSQLGSEVTHPGFTLRGRLGLGALPLSSFKVTAPTTVPLAHPLLGAPSAFPLSYSARGVIIAPPGSISQTAVPAFGVTGSSFGERSGISGTAAILPTLSPSAITAHDPFIKQFPVYAYAEGIYVRRISKDLDLGLRLTIQASTPALFGTKDKGPLDPAEQMRRTLQEYQQATQTLGATQTPAPYGVNLSLFGRFSLLEK